MTKRVLALLCAVILTAALFPGAFAANSVSLKFTPEADWHGIDVKLDALLDSIGATADQGEYEFAFTVKTLENGGIWKILTQAGDTPPAHARYTLRDELNGTFTLKTTTRGDEPNQGPIPAAEIRAAADAGQMMRLCQQGTDVPFIIDEITVVHIVGGVRTSVYKMSEDPGILAMAHNEEFEGTDFLQRAGDFPIVAMISSETATASPSPTATTAPTSTPSSLPSNPKTGDAFPAVMAITLLSAAAVGIFVLTRKKASKEG